MRVLTNRSEAWNLRKLVRRWLFLAYSTQSDEADCVCSQDTDRAPRAEWLVAIGVCTHLGCIPSCRLQLDNSRLQSWIYILSRIDVAARFENAEEVQLQDSRLSRKIRYPDQGLYPNGGYFCPCHGSHMLGTTEDCQCTACFLRKPMFAS